ncbi:hypothetical protein NECAME_02347 [Necator americanus]|uniref:ZP domain-containing protein n=1 Tax=Necator americanus TaxID=51031 RepID=W2TEW5_NECAM|nr:hypothetical protein NECAME_02347 [Necator americanus]ETN80600.1 hypothetical protein NECAME_02347 [Necator americanus]
MLPSEPLNNDVIVPSCSYTIRKDSLDGPILSYARVGEQVVHRWNCDSEQFGILVHSCIVEDGQGERQTIIDENGCHTDRRLLGDPTYAEALNMAYRESFVFKFADRTALRFKCGIRLCLKIDGGCDGVTPPLCINETRLQENSVQRNVLQYRRLRLRRSPKSSAEKDADLLSQQLYILDNSDEELTQLDGGHASPPHMLCLSLYTSAWTTYLIATGFLVSLTFALLQGHKTGKSQSIFVCVTYSNLFISFI